MSTYVGVDGCRFGWVAVSEEGNKLTYRMQRTMRALLAAYPEAECVLVDIPIGLPWKGCPVRPCDRLARQQLTGRASSVFPVPCRTASHAGEIDTARRQNIEALDRSLSAQTWGICKKIAEVDDLLLSGSVPRGLIREIHPEVCFWGLNGRAAMQHRKSSGAGVRERVEVLTRYEPRTEALLETALDEQLRRDLKADDVLDALVGFVVARAMPRGIESLHGNPLCDERGLPMEMVYSTGGPRRAAS